MGSFLETTHLIILTLCGEFCFGMMFRLFLPSLICEFVNLSFTDINSISQPPAVAGRRCHSARVGMVLRQIRTSASQPYGNTPLVHAPASLRTTFISDSHSIYNNEFCSVGGAQAISRLFLLPPWFEHLCTGRLRDARSALMAQRE